MNDTPLYSIVIPVFNGAKTLIELYQRIDAVFREINCFYEMILVEDGGGDDSWSIMKRLRKDHPHVKIIQMTRNFGQHNALICGFSFAKGEYVITLDDDLQNPPEEIPKLIEAMMSSGCDVVFGVPEKRKHSLWKNIGSFFHQKMISWLFKLKPDTKISNYRMIRKEIIDHVLQFSTPNPALGFLLLAVTDRVKSVTVKHHQRTLGNSNYGLTRMLKLFFNGLLYYSDLPLKVVFFMGIGCLTLSGVLGIYYFILYLSGAIGVTGWTTIVLLVLFFSGIGMFSIGIIGEYLLRIIQEANRMPQYVIREKDI